MAGTYTLFWNCIAEIKLIIAFENRSKVEIDVIYIITYKYRFYK